MMAGSLKFLSQEMSLIMPSSEFSNWFETASLLPMMWQKRSVLPTSIPRKRSGLLGNCFVFFMGSMLVRKGTQNISRRKSHSLIKTDSEDLRCCSDLEAMRTASGLILFTESSAERQSSRRSFRLPDAAVLGSYLERLL